MRLSETSDIDALDWEKTGPLLPAIVQDAFDGRLLMQAWVNREALEVTLDKGLATFWSRSREALWTKGETSGNFLTVDAVHADCDRDCILVLAHPHGPTCHRGQETCFDEDGSAVQPLLSFLAQLERVIEQRQEDNDEESYTARLLASGLRRVAQKVGEEGVETALAGSGGEEDELCGEAADLLYHLLVLLRARDVSFERVLSTLADRHR